MSRGDCVGKEAGRFLQGCYGAKRKEGTDGARLARDYCGWFECSSLESAVVRLRARALTT